MELIDLVNFVIIFLSQITLLPRNLALGIFDELLSVLNKAKSAIPLLFNDQEVLSSASDKVVYCIWNYLPMKCFPFTYDLSGFKSRINRHVLTIASF